MPAISSYPLSQRGAAFSSVAGATCRRAIAASRGCGPGHRNCGRAACEGVGAGGIGAAGRCAHIRHLAGRRAAQ